MCGLSSVVEFFTLMPLPTLVFNYNRIHQVFKINDKQGRENEVKRLFSYHFLFGFNVQKRYKRFEIRVWRLNF